MSSPWVLALHDGCPDIVCVGVCVGPRDAEETNHIMSSTNQLWVRVNANNIVHQLVLLDEFDQEPHQRMGHWRLRLATDVLFEHLHEVS